jgi:hypothetical protein
LWIEECEKAIADETEKIKEITIRDSTEKKQQHSPAVDQKQLPTASKKKASNSQEEMGPINTNRTVCSPFFNT